MTPAHRTTLAGLATLALLAAPTAAQAHVTLQPSTATAGAFTLESVRVPNEMDDATTTKVDVQLPHGFAAARAPATTCPGTSPRATTVMERR